MKILVADDDQASRRLVTAFLSRADYEVEAVDSGEDALEVMLGPEPPSIAILDWVMPTMSGPEVCTRLRNATLRIRPYVILLSAKTDKASIAEGLDAGADDFLSKPFNPLEMLARVRVAERALKLQFELHQHIDDLEALAQRYNLLGELIGRQGSPRERSTAPQPATAASPVVAAAPATRTTRLQDGEIDTVVQRALAEIGLGDVAPATDAAEAPVDLPRLVAWAGLVLTHESCWLDLLLDIDLSAAARVHEMALQRRPGSDAESRRFLAEMHTIVSAAFKAELQSRGADILAPGLTRAVLREQGARPLPVPEDRVRRTYGVKGVGFSLMIGRHACAIEMREPRQLQVGQIVAREFPSPEVDAIPLVTRGLLLNERFIGKLIGYAQRGGTRELVPVYAPSPLAKAF